MESNSRSSFIHTTTSFHNNRLIAIFPKQNESWSPRRGSAPNQRLIVNVTITFVSSKIAQRRSAGICTWNGASTMKTKKMHNLERRSVSWQLILGDAATERNNYQMVKRQIERTPCSYQDQNFRNGRVGIMSKPGLLGFHERALAWARLQQIKTCQCQRCPRYYVPGMLESFPRAPSNDCDVLDGDVRYKLWISMYDKLVPQIKGVQ